MGDEDRRAALHERHQAVHDLRLARRVEARGRLVEHEDRRVAQQDPRDPDALALAARQPDALRPERAVEAAGQAADEVLGVGRAGGADDVLARRVAAVGDVLGDGAGEQHRVLQEDPDLVAKPVERAVARVAAVDEDRAGGRVVEARDERADRRLAGPRRPDDRHPLAGGEPQRDAVEHRAVGLVRERDVAQLDVALRAALGERARAVLEDLVGAQDLRDALGAGHVARDARRLLGEVGQRAVHAPRVLRDHDEVADADRAATPSRNAPSTRTPPTATAPSTSTTPENRASRLAAITPCSRRSSLRCETRSAS